MASMVAIIPLYVACLGVSFLTAQLVVQAAGGGFDGFLPALLRTDAVLHGHLLFGGERSSSSCSSPRPSVLLRVSTPVAAVGVGIAAGHAMRAAITVIIIATCCSRWPSGPLAPARDSGDSGGNLFETDGRGPSERTLLVASIAFMVVAAYSP